MCNCGQTPHFPPLKHLRLPVAEIKVSNNFVLTKMPPGVSFPRKILLELRKYQTVKVDMRVAGSYQFQVNRLYIDINDFVEWLWECLTCIGYDVILPENFLYLLKLPKASKV